MQITFDRKFVNNCLQQKFVLPTYQRGYQWDSKHLDELMTDVQEAFLGAWKPEHGRKDVLGYEQYFLGTIITTQVGQGGKAIVDGQQRITTLTLLLSYVHRYSRKYPELNISPVDQSIRRKVAGQNEFNLDMDPSRKELFDLLMDGPADEEELSSRVDSISNIDPSTERIWALYNQIDRLIAAEIRDNGLLPHFFDYLTECVCMFEIGVPREQDGHKVFVTMNDRGLKLSPIDLLKGFLLSSITTNEENQEAHASWAACIRKLKELGSDEDSNFFKTWLRAKYANSTRGKKRGDAPGDFELIGESYHRWVIDNKDLMGLGNSDDFYNLLTGTLPFYVELYCRVKSGEKAFHENFPHVYYNGVRDLTLQAMVILSSVRHNDASAISTKKIRAVSYYLDYLATVRLLNGKENTYDNIRDLIFELTKNIRDLDLNALGQRLLGKVDAEPDKIANIVEVGYLGLKRADLLHLLARLSDYVERALDATNKVGFPVYVDRTRDSKNFDIEHLVADNLSAANAEIAAHSGTAFSNTTEFVLNRNRIGALILLPRGRNRSMKDMPYTQKIERYAGENVLGQTLTPSFYMNQPNWARFIAETGIRCEPVPFIDLSSIERRSQFYLALAEKIWAREQLEQIFG